jgi:hypothetical protein
MHKAQMRRRAGTPFSQHTRHALLERRDMRMLPPVRLTSGISRGACDHQRRRLHAVLDRVIEATVR